VDLTSNHAYKMSFMVDNNVAIMLRAGTHKKIDRSS
jgi:hypothetical protein